MNFLNHSNETEVVQKPKNSMKKAVVSLVVILALAASGAAAYLYLQLDELKKNPNKAAQEETTATIAAVSKLIVLPTDEEPTIATVTEPEKLKEQAFFASAKKGDKVLVYTKARKAILYSPSENKIVEVAPINIGATDRSQVSGTTTENQ